MTCNNSLHLYVRSLTYDMAILIAVALVQSRLDYCNSLFLTCHVSISVSSSVSKILLPGLLWMIGAHPSNRFFLTCTGSPFKPELNSKFALLHISYVLSENQPANLGSLITSYGPPCLLRSSDQCLLTQPRTRTCIGQRAFLVCAPTHCLCIFSFPHLLQRSNVIW